MSRTIDLNADLGEGFPWDRDILGFVTSASICCGAHAGDPSTIRQTLAWAKENGVMVGAHPGYPDREGFGRRERSESAKTITRLVLDQVHDLIGWAEPSDLSVDFLKPHGALYNQAQSNSEIGDGILDAASALGLPLLGLPGSRLESVAREHGITFLREGFPDRRYRDDGSLSPRSEPDAILSDPLAIAGQLDRLLDNEIDTFCIHGDQPDSIALVTLLHRLLREKAFSIQAAVPRIR